MLGGAIGTNLGHPTVNYSYLGLMTQYTYKPNNLIHPSFQVLLAAASTKDYQRPKSSLFDNYMNSSGENFYFVEPGLNLEVNLSQKVRLVTGFSYRYAYGLDENSEYVSLTNVTNKDMSGINLNFGIKFGMY